MKKSMYQFIESIHIHEGVLQNFRYHQERITRTVEAHYQKKLALDPFIQSIDLTHCRRGSHKLRVVYSDRFGEYTVTPYHPRPVSSLKIIEAEKYFYDYKYADRTKLAELAAQKGECDEIIIAVQGVLTDTSFSNLLFKKAGIWYTPERPLLHGTKRAALIDAGEIQTAVITRENYTAYEEVSLINALLDPGIITLGTREIYCEEP